MIPNNYELAAWQEFERAGFELERTPEGYELFHDASTASEMYVESDVAGLMGEDVVYRVVVLHDDGEIATDWIYGSEGSFREEAAALAKRAIKL